MDALAATNCILERHGQRVVSPVQIRPIGIAAARGDLNGMQ